MKTFVRTIMVFVAVNLITAGFASAQNASDEETLAAQKQAEIARREAEVVQRQVEAAQRQAEAHSRQVVVAQQSILGSPPEPPGPPPEPPAIPVVPSLGLLETRISSLDRRLSSWPRSGSTGAVLVIPSEQIKTEYLVAVTEDMRVMSAIFRKNLQQVNIAPSGGSFFVSSRDPFARLLGGSRGAIQSMYLQGYGVLFLMNVDFPLSPPPQVEEKEEAEKKEDTDPVWDQMKRDMYEPQAARRRKTDRPAEKYDAEKVKNLKTTVINALKHASNIRNMKPDESVILTITGSDASTVLTIRVKKSDIDGLARGEFDLDQFRQRVQMLSYPLLGGAAGSGGTFDFYHKYKSTLGTVPTF